MHVLASPRRARLGLLLALLSACASSGDPSLDLTGVGPGDGGANRCEPGSTIDCTCLGGAGGTKTCRASGQSYGECTGCMGEPDFRPPTVADLGGNPCGDCNGCCDGETCVEFGAQINTQCGAAGEACASCGAMVCDTSNGTCVAASGGACGDCTDGCCGMLNGAPHCYVDSPTNCGTGGGSCTACMRGQSCDGACNGMLDQSLSYRVIVTSLSVYNTMAASGSASDDCWDWHLGVPYTCGYPDLKVCFGYTQGSAFVEGCTTVKNDVNVPAPEDTPTSVASTTWNDTDGLIKNGAGQVFYVPGVLFATGKVRISIRDDDNPSDDEIIAQSYIPGQPNYYSGYMIGAFGRNKDVRFKFR